LTDGRGSKIEDANQGSAITSADVAKRQARLMAFGADEGGLLVGPVPRLDTLSG
jgi:hypothetical protein